MEKNKKKSTQTIGNKRANYDYTILETEIVGVILVGSEVGPLRAGKAQITESFVYIDIDTNSIYIKNMYIKNDLNSAYTHTELRDRKLLMTKKQISKWSKKMETEKLTIVPIRAYFDNKQKFKMEIGLAKGKKLFEKRDKILKKDIDRENSLAV